jgi:hypothetical protein
VRAFIPPPLPPLPVIHVLSLFERLRLLLLGTHNQLLDLEWKLIGVPVRAPRAIRQSDMFSSEAMARIDFPSADHLRQVACLTVSSTFALAVGATSCCSSLA